MLNLEGTIVLCYHIKVNESIFYFFYNFAHQSAYLDWVIMFFAQTFSYIVAMLAGLFLLFHHEVFRAENPLQVFLQKKKEILLVFFSGTLGWVVAKVLKIIIGTSRPLDALLAEPLFTETGYAFPSGHATFFMALAVSLFFYHKKVGYLFMFFAVLIGLARIAGGVHFPIDILGGFALGALVAYFVKKL